MISRHACLVVWLVYFYNLHFLFSVFYFQSSMRISQLLEFIRVVTFFLLSFGI